MESNRKINSTTVCKETDRAHVAITLRCNNNCIFCLQGHHPHITHRSFENLKKEIDVAAESGVNKIILSGGEPTAHPEYLKIVKYCKEQNFKTIQTISNGRMFSMEKFAKSAVFAGLTEATLSIHGADAETHDYLVNVPGAFEQVVKASQNLKKLGIIISVDVGIFKQNYRQLPEIVNFIYEDLGLKGDIDLIGPAIYGSAEENFEKIAMKYEYVEPYLKKALKIAKEKNIVCWVLRVPLKYMEGYEIFRQDNEKLVEEALSISSELTKFPAWCKGEKCHYCRMQFVCDKLETIYPVIFNNIDGILDLTIDKNYKNNIEYLSDLKVRFDKVIISNKEAFDGINLIASSLNYNKILIDCKGFSEEELDKAGEIALTDSKKFIISYDFVGFNENISSIFGINKTALEHFLRMSSKIEKTFKFIITKKNSPVLDIVSKKLLSMLSETQNSNIKIEFTSFPHYDFIKRNISWTDGFSLIDYNDLVVSFESVESKLINSISIFQENGYNVSISEIPLCVFSKSFLDKYSNLFLKDRFFKTINSNTICRGENIYLHDYIKFVYKDYYKERIKACDNCKYSSICAGFDPMYLKYF